MLRNMTTFFKPKILPRTLSARGFSQSAYQLTKLNAALTKQFPSVGMVRGCDAGQHVIAPLGSGVYIGNRTILTAAHCLDDVTQAGFSLDGYHWYDCTQTMRHPVYVYLQEDDRPDYETSKYDIAIARLSGEPITEKHAAKIAWKDFTAGDCIAIGYPMTEEFLAQHGELQKSARMLPYCFSTEDDMIKHHIGKTKDQQRNIHPLEALTVSGMSGGGLFKNGELIGLIRASSKKIFVSEFVNLGFHREWLRREIQKPSVDLESKSASPACKR